MKYIKNSKKLTKYVLTTLSVLTIGTVTVLGAAINGDSSSSGVNVGGGSGSYRPINDLNIESQGFSYNVYFLEYPAELRNNDPSLDQARIDYWNENFSTKAKKVNDRELLVSRDGAKKFGNGIHSAFIGDKFSTLAGGKYTRSRLTGSSTDLVESVNASDIGINNTKFPVYIHSVNGTEIHKGQSTFEFLSMPNPNYVEGVTAPLLLTEDAKNLTRYLGGINTDTGLARISFKDDPEEVELNGKIFKKNEQSIFENSMYDGSHGVYYVVCEGYVVANGTAYTLPELAVEAEKEGLHNSYLYSLKPSFVEAMGNVYLQENSVLGLSGGDSYNIIEDMTTREVMEAFGLDNADIYN